MSEISYREATPADIPALSEFHKFRDPNVWMYEYWTYKPPLSTVMLATRDSAIVGSQALIPYYLMLNGRPLLSGRSERTLVASSQRGKGTFAKLMAECIEHGRSKGMRIVWGATSQKAFARVGFEFVTGHREYLIGLARVHGVWHSTRAKAGSLRLKEIRARFGSRDRAYVSSLAKLAMTMLALPLSAFRFAGVAIESVVARGVTFSSSASAPDDLRNLFNKALSGHQPCVHLDQTPTLQHWLLDQSQHVIRRFYAYRGSALVAYTCWSINGDTADLIDFLAIDRRDLFALLHHARRALAQAGIVFLTAAINVKNPKQRQLRIALLATGMLPYYRGGTMVIHRMGEALFPQDISGWYVTELWFLLYGHSRLPG